MLRSVVNRIRNTVIFATISVLAGSLSYWNSTRNGLQSIQADADRRLDRFENALFAPVERYNYLPDVVANHPAIVDTLLDKGEPGRLAQANTFLERLNAEAKTEAIYLMDAEGGIHAASNWREPRSFVGRNFSFEPYFIDAMRSGSGRFYGTTAVTLAHAYFISHWVKPGSMPLGVAVVAIDLKTLDGNWDTNGEFTVSDANGIIFLSSRKDWIYRPTFELEPIAEDRASRSGQYAGVLKQPPQIVAVKSLRYDSRIVEVMEPRVNGREMEGISYLLTSRILPKGNWTISSYVPLKDNQNRAIHSAFMAVGVVSFILIFALYVRQTSLRAKEREGSRKVLETKNCELQRINDELRTISITDHLTDAYTRRFFYDSLGKFIHAARRSGVPLAVIIIDIDHFKEVNDTYGHPVGDEVLQTIVVTCRQLLRETDVFARLGGEEFIAALPDTDRYIAHEVAERLRLAVMSTGITVSNVYLQVTISIGISQYRPTDLKIDNVIERADRALYKAKRSGRNQVVMEEMPCDESRTP